MKAIKAIVVAVALGMAFQAGVFHASAQQSIVDRWYAALLQADRAALSELLADDATIRLDDLGVTQSKDEFIASMDEWQSAVKGAAIRHRVESEVGDTIAVLTCYDFPNNDMAMRETFTTKDGRIVANTQMTIGEDCDGI